MASSDDVRPDEMEPIFVLGRQHSGNTMLTTLLGRVPGVLGVTGEGGFFEVRDDLDKLPPQKRALRTARRIRDDGVRAFLQDPGTAADMSMWEEIKPLMVATARRGASATELYVQGMREVLRRTGTERWAQKATSYIFSAEDVLATFPRARLIFLVRNPLDLAASTARRNGSFRHTVRLAMGWNRGVREALRLQAEMPAAFRIVRYEDLVRDSERVVREVCAFCALPFDVSYLEIPHVNKSDSPHNTVSKEHGVNASRVFYYRDVLDPAEQTAVRMAIDLDVLDEVYPELRRQDGARPNSRWLRASGLLAFSALNLLKEEGGRLATAPSLRITSAVQRIGKRLR